MATESLSRDLCIHMTPSCLPLPMTGVPLQPVVIYVLHSTDSYILLTIPEVSYNPNYCRKCTDRFSKQNPLHRGIIGLAEPMQYYSNNILSLGMSLVFC